MVLFMYDTTNVEHNLLQFMDIASKQHGLALNSAKCYINFKKVSFLDQLRVYTSEVIKLDYQNMKNLREVPIPTTKAEMLHLIGFIAYL